MVFLAKGAKTWKCRVDHPDGRHAVLSTGCRNQRDADDIEAAVHRWQGRKGKRYERRDVLDAIIDKRVTLAEAYDADLAGTLDALLGANAPTVPGVDLLEIIDRWVEDKKRGKGAGQAETYKKQVLELYPERPLTLDKFTLEEVWRRIDELDVESPTRNRYRSAASSLAKYCVKRRHIATNFVRQIEGYGENDPRLVYYEIDDAKRILKALEQPYAAIAAYALAFAAEWGAIERAVVGDLTLETDPVVGHIRGTKRSWRDRYVPLVPELAFALAYIKPQLVGKFQGALVLDAVPEWRAIDVIRAAASTLKIKAIGEDVFGPHSIHDWRHTHAVALLRWGYNEQIVADHLGHKNTTLVRNNYGRFKPTAYDYARASNRAGAVTDSITSQQTPKASRGGKRR
jgi:integrase